MILTAATEELRRRLEAIRDETKLYANTANRIGNAFLALLNYLCDAPFLRKDSDDSTAYLLTLLAGCVIGESKAITLNPDGSIHCGSITVDGSAIFNELVFNHQNILEGDTYFTDRGIIEKVEHTDLGQYRLTFRKEYDEEVTTFHANDIIMGKVNNLDRARTYYTFWLLVNSVDTESNTALCTLYSDEDVPGGKNYPPVAAARVIRWGNTLDTTRQSVWFVSSNDGRWLFLQGVHSPILEDSENGSNYAGFIGLPPEITAVQNLIDRGVITKDQPYVYFRGIITQDIIKVDYKGAPMYTARDKGRWNADTEYIKDYDSVEKGYFVDRCWHGGCLWQCNVKECKGSEPRFNNTDWSCLLGSGNNSMTIESSAGDFFRSGTKWSTDLTATVWNAEMKLTEEEIGKQHITWLRTSGDNDGDTAWNIKHPTGSTGLTLSISSEEDLPGDWRPGSQVGFTCVVTIPDMEPIQQSYSIAN